MAQQSQRSTPSEGELLYKGGLASQKYFTPQELHNLTRVGKKPLFAARPPSGTKRAVA